MWGPGGRVTTAAAVRKAAELVAISEQMRRDALRNGCIDPDALLRFEGISSRAVRQLGLDRRREPEGLFDPDAPLARFEAHP